MNNQPTINLRLKRGDDCGQPVELYGVEGKPFDLAAVKRIDLHANAVGKPALKLSTTDGSIKVTDKKRGRFLLHFPHQLTQAAKWQRAEYDLQLVFVGDLVHTVAEGNIYLSGDATVLQDIGTARGVIVTNPPIKATITATELPTVEAGNELDNKPELVIPDFIFTVKLHEI